MLVCDEQSLRSGVMVHNIRKVFFAARRVFLWKVTYILHNIIIQINIGYKSAPKQYNLYTPRRRHMGKSIARGCKEVTS